MYKENKLLYLIIVILFIFISGLSYTVKADTIIVYDNLTTSNLKTIEISDDLNYKFINEYSYPVYINDQFLGNYKKGELIYYDNNSNITIRIPESINTNIENSFDLTKPAMIIVVGFLITFGFFLLFIYFLWNKFIRGK